MIIIKRVPIRYQNELKSILVDDITKPIHTSVGIRYALMNVWECKLCKLRLKPDNAAAQSHITKHVRDIKTVNMLRSNG